MTPPTIQPNQTPADPGANEAEANRPDGSAIEELNRQTLPKTPDGQLIDPKQEEAKDTGG